MAEMREAIGPLETTGKFINIAFTADLNHRTLGKVRHSSNERNICLSHVMSVLGSFLGGLEPVTEPYSV